MGMGFDAYASGAAIFGALFLVLCLTFFGAICFVADDMRRYLKQLTDNLPANKAPSQPSAAESPAGPAA